MDAARAEALDAALRRALDAPLGAPLAVLLPPRAQLLIVLDGGAVEEVEGALPRLARALDRAAHPRGRRLAVVATGPDGLPARDAAARYERAVPGLRVAPHDPLGSHPFVPGDLAPDLPLELDDLVLEAEAVVLVGPVGHASGGGVTGGAALLAPGLASAACAARMRRLAGDPPAAAREACSRAATELVQVDLALCWVRGPGGRVQAFAGRGTDVLAASARAARRHG